MSEKELRWIYGPVFSRRLGRSLGIDLVPFKVCTYDCLYCQLGRTTNKTMQRGTYSVERAEDILDELKERLELNLNPDYISLAGSGEPTLNTQIGPLIDGIKGMTDIPVAVLTNGSLLWMEEVRKALMGADLVLPSLDAGDDHAFRLVNRPHRSMDFEKMVAGIAEFSRVFPGSVWLEVFVLDGITGKSDEMKKIAALAERIAPERVQLNTVSRPPTEKSARAVDRDALKELSGLFTGKVEVISENLQEDTSPSAEEEAGDSNILSLLSRRPCTVEGVAMGLGLKTGTVVKRLGVLVKQGAVKTVRGNNDLFYESTRNE